MTAPPDLDRTLPALARSLLGSSALVLALGAFLNQQGETTSAPDLVSWIACTYVPAAVLGAVLFRGQGLVALPPDADAPARERAAFLTKTLVFFAILESAVLLCALALIVSRPLAPFAAALVPFAVMALNLPPRSS